MAGVFLFCKNDGYGAVLRAIFDIFNKNDKIFSKPLYI